MEGSDGGGQFPAAGGGGVCESSMFVIVSTATGKLPRFIAISFPMATSPELLVLTYIVMFPDALCEVAS